VLEGKNYNATFLPEVALEHNFTKDVTLQHLIKKAGQFLFFKESLGFN